MSKKFKSNPARTVLTITVGFLIFYIITHQKWALNLSVVLGIIGVLSTYLSQKIEWLWMKIGWFMGLIVPKIILSAIFYLILFPLATLANFFKSTDALMLKDKQDSTFNDMKKEFDKASFENPW